MKKVLTLFSLIICFSSFAQEVRHVPKGIITGDFTIRFVNKDVTLAPHKVFSIDDLQLKEYHRSPKSWKKIGREHIFWPVVHSSYMGASGVVFIATALPILSVPAFALSTLAVHRASIKATRAHMDRVSQPIVLTRSGKEYTGKIAFFKVHKRCGKTDVGREYHISISDERLSKLDDNTYTDIAEYEYCSKHNRVTWVIWDLRKAAR